MLTDTQWTMSEPPIEVCRPNAKVAQSHLRRTMSAILWRHENAAKWRALPAELGPWWMAAQTFTRWARLGVWERPLNLMEERGVQLGMTFLDETNVRAHQKAAGAARKGALKLPSKNAQREDIRISTAANATRWIKVAPPSSALLAFNHPKFGAVGFTLPRDQIAQIVRFLRNRFILN